MPFANLMPCIFQSTPPRGRRRSTIMRQRKSSTYFNPRLREGGDQRTLQLTGKGYRFQSTPPRGRRRKAVPAGTVGRIDFNPRLREGGDDGRFTGPADIANFNPRLREGGDRDADGSHGRNIYFNPRLREGGDGRNRGRLCGGRNFNPRLREGGDEPHPFTATFRSISIHASAREATSHSRTRQTSSEFQSTPPRGRRPH